MPRPPCAGVLFAAPPRGSALLAVAAAARRDAQHAVLLAERDVDAGALLLARVQAAQQALLRHLLVVLQRQGHGQGLLAHEVDLPLAALVDREADLVLTGG